MTESAAPTLLLGADIGGTATRVAVSTVAGEVLGVAAGPAGNPNSVGLEVSAQRIRAVAEQCLARAGTDAADRVAAAVIGLAGGARADESFLTAVRPTGVRVRPRLVSDLAVAFSSATPSPEGYVLVAGTGAVAGRIVDGELRERRDGWGWLLGDEGSGFWLGREAIRATLTRLQKPDGAGRSAGGGRHRAGRDPRPGRDRPALLREPPGLAVDLRRAGDAPRRGPGGGSDRLPRRRSTCSTPCSIWISIRSSRWCWRARWPPVRARSVSRCGRASTSGCSIRC